MKTGLYNRLLMMSVCAGTLAVSACSTKTTDTIQDQYGNCRKSVSQNYLAVYKEKKALDKITKGDTLGETFDKNFLEADDYVTQNPFAETMQHVATGSTACAKMKAEHPVFSCSSNVDGNIKIISQNDLDQTCDKIASAQSKIDQKDFAGARRLFTVNALNLEAQ